MFRFVYTCFGRSARGRVQLSCEDEYGFDQSFEEEGGRSFVVGLRACNIYRGTIFN